jgi:hypothetical protein
VQQVGLAAFGVGLDRLARPFRDAAVLADGGPRPLIRRVFAYFPLCNRYTVTKPVVIGLLAFSNRYNGFGCNGLK